MSTKTINIALPQIEGVGLKSATVDLKKGVITVEYGQEDLYLTVKRGDFLTCLSDPSKTVIFNTVIPTFEKTEIFTVMYSLPMIINGEVAHIPLGTKFPLSNFRHSTEEEKALMIKEMVKWGKRYNPEARRIENIEQDISEIAVDYKSAADYLYEDIHQFTIGATKNHSSKLSALNHLMILAEAWNKFDEFKPDWTNRLQDKYYPVFELKDGKIEFWDTSSVRSVRLVLNPYTLSFSFKTPERAKQFGKQFIELFRIVLTN